MFQGCTTENVQKAFDEFNEIGFDLGGAGPALRTSMSCVGHARCEMSCYDEVKAHRSVINEFLDEMHRPALPYKFKFKFSGCGNDCVNAIHRADFAVIGTWRDDMKVDQEEVKAYVERVGRKYMIDTVIANVPDARAEPQRRRHARRRQQVLRALHALPQRDDQGALARRRQGRGDPDRRQALAQGRRPHGHRDHALHQARNRRGLREARRVRPHV